MEPLMPSMMMACNLFRHRPR